MKLIDEINTILDDFIDKIKNEHHKGMDGVWQMSYDLWVEKWFVTHRGYWLDEIHSSNTFLSNALKSFKRKLEARIDIVVGEYDFINHHAYNMEDE